MTMPRQDTDARDSSEGLVAKGQATLISSWIGAARSWGAVPIIIPSATLAVVVAAGLLYSGFPQAPVMFLASASLVILVLVQAARELRQRRDLHASRQTAAAVEASLHALVESIPAVVVVVDPAQTLITFINPAAAGLIDASPDHPEWRRLARAVMEPTTESNGRVTFAFQRAGGGTTSLRGAQRQIVWNGRPQILLALADTTQLRDAELQVMQAAKLATLGEMATAIAHELNQPLAVIKMAATNARRLLTSGADAAQITAKLDRVSDQVDRAKRITDQVRRYGRLPAQQMSSFALGRAIELAAGFVADQYRTAGIRLDFDVDLPPDLKIFGDETMFEQVIVNLLINARDAFDATSPDGRQPVVAIHARVFGGEVTIAVSDNAGGIRDDIIGRLFEPFATTKPADKGTGLGLSLSRKVVKDMNGTITAGNVGGGARFLIRVPVLVSPRRTAELAAPAVAASSARRDAA
jgi:C4-dicarboxylate-specific signal transduction histidine kinase